MSPYDVPRVLVTGGAGFLGSHLCERLLAEDDPVRRCPDITRARTLLGREPKTRLREGLEKRIGSGGCWRREAPGQMTLSTSRQ